MSDARESAVVVPPSVLGYPPASPAEAYKRMVTAAFMGIPNMKEGEIDSKPSNEENSMNGPKGMSSGVKVVGEAFATDIVHCPMARTDLSRMAARQYHQPEGSDGACVCAACGEKCLN